MVDVVDATFETEVMERSDQVPVVIDLWATWCNPCLTLGPILERAVAATNGAVVLAKVDVDANHQIATAFRAQSIPAVYAMHHRKIVDQFLGAQPESVVNAFVEKLLPTPEQSELERLIEAGDEASLRAALEIESDNPDAVCGLAELLAGGDDDARAEAERLLARIPDTPRSRRVAALVRAGGGIGADTDVESRLDAMLASVKDDEAVRQEFVDLLELLGPDDPRTAAYRRKLMARLF